MPLVGHGLGILGLEELPDVLPVLEVVLRAQVEVKAKLEVLEELAPARASGDELMPGGSDWLEPGFFFRATADFIFILFLFFKLKLRFFTDFFCLIAFLHAPRVLFLL